MTPYEKAEQRVNASKDLSKHKNFILYDWPEGDQHWEWVITAPTNEITDWVESCLKHVDTETNNQSPSEGIMDINLYELHGDDLIERVEEFCGMGIEEIKTQWNGKPTKEILSDMNEMWPQDDCQSLADAVSGLVR